MMNNLLSFRGYQGGGEVDWGDYDPTSTGSSGIPTFEDVISSTGTSYANLPEGYLDMGYEYDPSRREYLAEKYERGKKGKYTDLLSTFGDIGESGEGAISKLRRPTEGGFAGSGNLLDMTAKNIYSGVGRKRGEQLGEYGEAIEEMEAETREGMRLDIEDYVTGATEHLGEMEDLYGEPFTQRADFEGCVSEGGTWKQGPVSPGSNQIIWGCFGDSGDRIRPERHGEAYLG